MLCGGFLLVGRLLGCFGLFVVLVGRGGLRGGLRRWGFLVLLLRFLAFVLGRWLGWVVVLAGCRLCLAFGAEVLALSFWAGFFFTRR